MEHIYAAPWQWAGYGQSVELYEYCVILKPEVISIGDYSRIDAFCKLEGGQGITIGQHCHIASFSHINAGGGRVIFGDHSGCATGVKILSGHPDLAYLHLMPNEPPELVHTVRYTTTIGEYAIVFAGAIICPGVTIGKAAIIAAGAVVTKDVGDGEIWRGNPARKVGERSISE